MPQKYDPVLKHLSHLTYFTLIGLFILVGCNAPVTQSEPPPLAVIESQNTLVIPTATAPPEAPPTSQPTKSVSPSSDLPNTAPLPNEEWQTIAEGLEQRALPVTNDAGQLVEQLYILRIDQDQYRFDVGYSPGEPKTLTTWRIETDALAVINASFFTAEYYATGLTIVDGRASGATYDFGGMVVIKDGRVALRGLSAEPYNPDEAIDAGLQAFPLLVNRDGSAAFTEPSVNRHRRTVIGEDHSGRILLMIANRSWFTLTELSNFLANSDLDLAIAFNLDGGPSSGLLLSDPKLEIQSPVLIPAILIVERR